MDKIFDNIQNLRTTTLSHAEGLSAGQLNKIPEGFNNNIIWNLGHIIATTQVICYVRSGLQPPLDESFINSYKSGTKPDGFINEDEIEKIKSLLHPNIKKLKEDFDSGIFKEYSAITTRYGVELTSAAEAIDFLQFHEGFHMGYVLALKRVI